MAASTRLRGSYSFQQVDEFVHSEAGVGDDASERAGLDGAVGGDNDL